MKHIILKVIPDELLTENTKVMINPTGRLGSYGQKIIVDTYGTKGRR